MIVYVLVARGTTVLAEYGTTAQDFTEKIVAVLNRNHGSGTRLVQIGQHLCAVMTKTINQEDINFAAVIESNEERDNSFNFLDTLSVFFEKEAKNSKMTTEMNAFLSKNIKQQMVDFVVIEERANARLGSKEKLTNMQNSLSKTTQIAQNSISRRRSSSRSDGQ